MEDITTGVVKETSISCSVTDKECSICDESNCNNHPKGHKYGNKVCYSILKDISDVYEWSFVKEPDNEPEFNLTTHTIYIREIEKALNEVKMALDEAYKELDKTKSFYTGAWF